MSRTNTTATGGAVGVLGPPYKPTPLFGSTTQIDYHAAYFMFRSKPKKVTNPRMKYRNGIERYVLSLGIFHRTSVVNSLQLQASRRSRLLQRHVGPSRLPRAHLSIPWQIFRSRFDGTIINNKTWVTLHSHSLYFIITIYAYLNDLQGQTGRWTSTGRRMRSWYPPSTNPTFIKAETEEMGTAKMQTRRRRQTWNTNLIPIW